MSTRHQETINTHGEGVLSFFVRHGKVAFLLGLIIVVGGLFATNIISKESAPYIEYGIVNISTPYAGVSATDMDSLVTQEIENKIKSLAGLNKYTSVSQEGMSSITLEFDPGEDMIKAVSDIRSKVSEARSSLPSEIDEDPIVTEIDSSLQGFIKVSLYGDVPYTTLTNTAEKLRKKLEGVYGVANVDRTDGQETEIKVLVDRSAADSAGVSLDEIVQSIRSSHRNTPLGNLEIAHTEYTLRIEGKHKTATDVEEIIIKNIAKNGDNPTPLKISDIAEVREEGEDFQQISRLWKRGEGAFQNSVTLDVSRRSETDIFATDAKVRAAVEDFQKTLPKEIQVAFFQEMEPMMQEDFAELFTSGTISVIVVLFFIFLFVGILEGLIASLVIPLTFLGAIAALLLMGKTLNFMTNFSMILSLGILVDTAVVIVEGVHRFMKKGFSAKEAAILSLHEFKGPLISGTLTTLAVFIPLFTLPGILGQYLSFIPITVSLVLIIALFVSLFLISSYAGLLLPDEKKASDIPQKKSFLARIFEPFISAYTTFRKWFDGQLDHFMEWYKHTLEAVIREKVSRIVLFLGVFFGFIASFFLPIPFEMFPSSDNFFINISLEKPQGTDIEVLREEIQYFESELIKFPEVKLIKSTVSGNTGSMYVELLWMSEREKRGMRTALELEYEFDKVLKSSGNTDIRVRRNRQGPPSDFPVGFRVVADDSNFIPAAKSTAVELTEFLKTVPNTRGVKNDITEIPGEFRFTIDREKAIKKGLSPESIAGILRTAISGTTAATITRENRDIDVRVQFENSELKTITDVENIQIHLPTGGHIPVSSIATIERFDGLSAIRRQDGNIAFTVSSLLSEDGNAEIITTEVMSRLSELDIPNGVTILQAGENEENAELMQALSSAFVIAVMLMFFILVIQFNSFLQPILILQTILFAQVGVSVGLFLTETPRSLAYLLGVIALAGIVVNDAIIMIDQMNKNQKDSRFANIFEAIYSAGKSRLIPVVLTTLTTSAGILPLVFIDSFWAGLAYTIMFGLTMATFLTLFVTPATYIMFTPKKQWYKTP